jgi:hypothetical protein
VLNPQRLRLNPLHKKLDDAPDLTEGDFRETTVAGVLAEPTGGKPQCAFPPISVCGSCTARRHGS